MIKKLTAAVMALVFAVSLAACSDGGREEITVGTNHTSYSFADSTTTEPTEITTTTTPPTTTTTTEESTVSTVPFVPSGTREYNLNYLTQCAFVGDSVCMGLRVYGGFLSEREVFAQGSVGARNIHTFTFTVDGEEIDIVSCIEQKQPQEVFLWMGLNDINMTTKNMFADNLEKLANDVLSVSPDTKINIMGITPTTTWHTWGANDRIADYNENTRLLCEEKGYTYIDTWQAVAPDLESLPDECQSGDGLHLSPLAYQLVLGYICEMKGVIDVEVTTTQAPDITAAPDEDDDGVTSDYTPTGSQDFDAADFADCAFVGDSVCSGLSLYSGLLDASSVFAATNVTPRNIYSFTFSTPQGELDIVNCIKNKQPKEIFLWMGINEIKSVTPSIFFMGFDELAQKLLEVSPNSKINIVGMTPTTTWHTWGANDTIKQYNDYVKEMCDAKGYKFIDAWYAVAGENKALSDECQSGDGLHLKPLAYRMLLSYITDVMGWDSAAEPTPQPPAQDDVVVVPDVTTTTNIEIIIPA